MSKLPLFLILIIISITLISSSSSSLDEYYCRRPLFFFGDSFFDHGNNNYISTTTLDQANFWPYGETYFDHPTGRFSDGRLISDFIAQHAKMALIPPYLQPIRSHEKHYYGVNFASAGAGVLSQTFQGLVIDLRTQLRNYKKEISQLSKKTTRNAVYLFSIGTNDYISPFLLNSTILSSYSHSKYVGMVIGNLSIVIKEIYKKGGRKFVFLNLGELGCLPGLRILRPGTDFGGCLEEASQLAELHNKELEKLVSRMEQKLHGFKYFLYDFKSNLAQRINQPNKYGFKEGKKACCGTGQFNGVFSCGGKRPVQDFELCQNPSEFIFWDSYHLTENVYKQMADEMWSIPSLKNLFLCF